jgi:hypothetical protein
MIALYSGRCRTDEFALHTGRCCYVGIRRIIAAEEGKWGKTFLITVHEHENCLELVSDTSSSPLSPKYFFFLLRVIIRTTYIGQNMGTKVGI